MRPCFKEPQQSHRAVLTRVLADSKIQSFESAPMVLTWSMRTESAIWITTLPLAMKRNHISAAHTDADIERTLNIAEDVLQEMSRKHGLV